jgi:flagellin-specific chaperone FliS
MYQTASSGYYKANQVNAYLAKDILEASPQKLLIKIYDFAILNCKQQNLEKTNKAIQELINSLIFDDVTREVATGFLRLYLYCQEQMRKKNYYIVLKILTELRDTWAKAFNM